MKNLNQIQLIQTALSKEKEQHLHELAIVVNNIEKKMLTISRMIVYQNEYVNADNLQLSKSIPSLTKNLYAFSGKISDLIQQAEVDVLVMQKTQETILQSIEKVDHKMKLMSTFEEKAKRDIFLKKEMQEQIIADDLASIKHVRGEEYE